MFGGKTRAWKRMRAPEIENARELDEKIPDPDLIWCTVDHEQWEGNISRMRPLRGEAPIDHCSFRFILRRVFNLFPEKHHIHVLCFQIFWGYLSTVSQSSFMKTKNSSCIHTNTRTGQCGCQTFCQDWATYRESKWNPVSERMHWVLHELDICHLGETRKVWMHLRCRACLLLCAQYNVGRITRKSLFLFPGMMERVPHYTCSADLGAGDSQHNQHRK